MYNGVAWCQRIFSYHVRAAAACECTALWSTVAVWSGVNVAGTKLRDIAPKAGDAEGDPGKWNELHKAVISRFVKWLVRRQEPGVVLWLHYCIVHVRYNDGLACT